MTKLTDRRKNLVAAPRVEDGDLSAARYPPTRRSWPPLAASDEAVTEKDRAERRSLPQWISQTQPDVAPPDETKG